MWWPEGVAIVCYQSKLPPVAMATQAGSDVTKDNVTMAIQSGQPMNEATADVIFQLGSHGNETTPANEQTLRVAFAKSVACRQSTAAGWWTSSSRWLASNEFRQKMFSSILRLLFASSIYFSASEGISF